MPHATKKKATRSETVLGPGQLSRSGRLHVLGSLGIGQIGAESGRCFGRRPVVALGNIHFDGLPQWETEDRRVQCRPGVIGKDASGVLMSGVQTGECIGEMIKVREPLR